MTEDIKEINIRHFKLMSGDEILGLVRAQEEDYIVLEQPLQMHITSMTPERESYYFSEYMPLGEADGPTIVYVHGIVAQSEAKDEFKEQYIRTCLQMREVLPADELDIEVQLEDDYDFDMEYDEDPTKKTYH
jgi:hypothetical protein